MAMWSIYTIGLRWRPDGMHLLSFLFAIVCVGDVAIFPAYLLETAFGAPMRWTRESTLALCIVSLFSSVLAYIFWNRGVERVGASVAGLFVHLVPVFGVALAWLALGERVEPFHIVGIALILGGVYVTSRYTRVAIAAGTD